MGYAKYVGRVGALAVALGVGASVAATPGVAWADGVEDTNVAQDTNVSEASGGGAVNPESPGTGTSPVDRQDPGEAIRHSIERTADKLRTVIAGVVQSSGGAITSTHRTGAASRNGNVFAVAPVPMKNESHPAPLPTQDKAVAASRFAAPNWTPRAWSPL